MLKTADRLLRPFCILSLFFLSACSSTHILSTERTPELRTDAVKHVLVVGIVRAPQFREPFEDGFSNEWNKRGGVKVEASYRVLPENDPLDKENIAGFAKDHGFDSVLVARLGDYKKVKPHMVNSPGVPAGAGADAEGGGLNDYVHAVVASPQYDIDYRVAYVRTNLYDVATEKRIWSCTTQTLVTDNNGVELIRPFTKKMLKQLYEGK